MEVLYNRNRLNVAVSRAQGMAIIVASPALFRLRCKTPEQMRLANALCLFDEMATCWDESGRQYRPDVQSSEAGLYSHVYSQRVGTSRDEAG